MNAWEKRKLGEISPLRGGFAFKSSEFKDKGIPIIRISNIKSDGKVGGDFVYYHEQEVDQSYLLPQRAALLAMSGATTGKVAILHKQHEGKYYQNQRVGYFSKVKDASYSFISVLIRSDLFLKQLKSVLVAGAQPNVSSKEIDQFIFSVPATLNEQEKIGTFFEYLDSLIAATQHKIDALEQAKKALLQRLFDQSWRFKGYSDPWEKRKLGDILNYEQPTPYIVRSENYQNSFPTPVLTAGKSLLLGYTNETNGIKSASKSSPVIIFDDFTTSSHLIDFPFKIKSSAMKILSPSNNDSDIYFSFGLLFSINYVSKNHERHWISQFSNFRVQVPSVHEQACVSRVLLNVTDLIAATQSRLSSLELLKKALLQDLFI